MDTTIMGLYRDYIGIMEKKMETTRTDPRGPGNIASSGRNVGCPQHTAGQGA